mgnify:CR=1 FL=1
MADQELPQLDEDTITVEPTSPGNPVPVDDHNPDEADGHQNGLSTGEAAHAGSNGDKSENRTGATEDESSSAVEEDGNATGACNRVQSMPHPGKSRKSLSDVLDRKSVV